MVEEIKIKLKLLQVKIDGSEVGSTQKIMLNEIKKDLEERLRSEMKDQVAAGGIKLHKDEGATCDGCQ